MKTSKKIFTLILALCLILGLSGTVFAAAFEQVVDFDSTELTVTGDVDLNGTVTIESVMAGEEDVTAKYAEDPDLTALLKDLVYDADAARAEAFGIGGENNNPAEEADSADAAGNSDGFEVTIPYNDHTYGYGEISLTVTGTMEGSKVNEITSVYFEGADISSYMTDEIEAELKELISGTINDSASDFEVTIPYNDHTYGYGEIALTVTGTMQGSEVSEITSISFEGADISSYITEEIEAELKELIPEAIKSTANEGESEGGESGGAAAPAVYDNYIEESADYDTYTFDGSTYAAESGYLTVVVDGVEVDPADLNGEYEDVHFVVTPQIPAFVDGYESAYRTGLYIDNGIQEEYSVLEAVSGEYDDSSASGLYIHSENDNFEGIIAAGGEYIIDGLTIIANGSGTNDFAGVGAGIAVGGTADVTVNDYTFLAHGIIRHGMFIGGDTLTDAPVLTVNGGLIVAQNPEAEDGTTMYERTSDMSMASSPWMLGIEATPEVRTQLMASTGNSFYNDCVILSSGWGIVSSDAVDGPLNWGDYTINMNLDNCVLDFTGTSGYVSYAIGSTHNNFINCVIGNAIGKGVIDDEIAFAESEYGYEIAYEDGVEFDENGDAYNTTYALIVANETAGGTFDNCLYTGQYGVMYHKTNNVSYVPGATDNTAEEYPADGCTEILNSTFNTNGAAILVKACTPVIYVDNSAFNSKTGVIVQLATCDDPGMGSQYFSEVLDIDSDTEADPDYDPYDYNTKNKTLFTYDIENMINDVQVSFKDCVGETALNGDFYNSISVSTTGEGMTWWGQNLILTFDNCEINGNATSSKALHNNYSGFYDAEGNEVAADNIEDAIAAGAVEGRITSDNATYLGGMTNYASPAINNGVWVILQNGSVWTPESDCYLTVLDIDESCVINGTVTVNGEAIEGAGHYAGSIVVTTNAGENNADEEAANGESKGGPMMADGSMPPDPPADLAPGEEPPGGFGGID